MSERKLPPFGLPPVHRDRDRYVEKHAVPQAVEDEGTGRHEGEELARIRSRRPTPERISKVETRQDRIEKTLTDFRIETTGHLAGLSSSVNTLLTLASKADAERERRAAADLAARQTADALAANERADVRKHIPVVIKAIGAAIALIVAALLGKGAL